MKIPMFLILAAMAALAASCSREIGQKPDAQTEKLWLDRIIRYAGYMPKLADDTTKFDTIYDSFYAEQAARHRIDLLHEKPETGDVFLLVSRIAPSLKVKRVGIGIHARMEGDSMVYYKEVFRTWKMTEDALAEKGGKLFALMVKGKDLSPYYPEHSGEEEYIEFPDANTYYDAEKRKWISRLENPVEELRRRLEQGAQEEE